MYGLKIGWNTYLCNSAKQAAEVMDALDKLTLVDTLWCDSTHKPLYYLKEGTPTIERLTIGMDAIFPNLEVARAHNDRLNAEAEAIKAALESGAIVSVEPDKFDPDNRAPDKYRFDGE